MPRWSGDRAWWRVTWGVCQATGRRGVCRVIASGSPGFPFVVSLEVARRLWGHCLSPGEAFRLATVHGWGEYYLHDDFYNDETGEAWQPDGQVPDGDPMPELEGLLGTVEGVIDADAATATREEEWEGRLTDAMRGFTAAAVLPALDRRLTRWSRRGRPYPFVAERAMEVAHRVAGPAEAPWVRRWGGVMHTEGLDRVVRAMAVTEGGAAAVLWLREELGRRGWPGRDALALGTPMPSAWAWSAVRAARRVAPAGEAIEFAEWLISRLPEGDRESGAMSLMDFDDAAVLGVIERLAPEGRETIPGMMWGAAAALNRLDWSTAKRWLTSGPRLTRLALEALRNLKGWDPDDPNQSGAFKRRSPSLLGVPADLGEIVAEVNRAATRLDDADAMTVAREIAENLSKITDPARRPQ